MKILISTAGSHGDVLPFIAIGQEMKARGHEVLLYANPHFGDHVADAGLGFVPVGRVEEYERLFGEFDDSNPQQAFKRVARELVMLWPAYYQAMKDDVDPGQTIAVGSSLLVAHRLLRETDHVPCATVHLAPSIFRSSIKPARLVPDYWIHAGSPAWLKRLAWWASDQYYDPLTTQPLNRFRAKLDLAPVRRIFRDWIHGGDCVLGMFPDWFADRPADWPSNVELPGFPLYDHGTQSPLDRELQEFIAAGSPPVVFTAGTANANAGEFFRTSVEACRKADKRAIFLSHFKGQLPEPLPDGMIHVRYAPFGTLLPQVAAFVHHGGIGTTSQALKAGVPQLIRPTAYDQFDNAARAVRLGVACELLPKQYSADAVAAALVRLTSDQAMQARCRQLAARLVQGKRHPGRLRQHHCALRRPEPRLTETAAAGKDQAPPDVSAAAGFSSAAAWWRR